MKVMITIIYNNDTKPGPEFLAFLPSYGNFRSRHGARLQSKVISHNSARVPKVKSSWAFQSEGQLKGQNSQVILGLNS